MHSFARRTRAALLFLSCLAAPAASQAVLGPGDDAWHLPGGALRLSISSRFTSASEFFRDGSRSPLGLPYSGLIGSGQLPTLRWVEEAVQSLSGTSDFRARVGTSRADVQRQTAVIPLEASLGITPRVMMHATVRYHTGEQEVNWLLDANGATIGANPALSLQGAASSNAALVNGLDGAAASLEQRADACAADPSSHASCALITAELTQVRALIDDSRATTDALAATYGGRDGVSPLPFVPLSDQAAHAGAANRVADLRTRYERYEIASVDEGAAPAAAGMPLTPGELRSLLSSAEYGYDINAMTRRYQQGFGDTDVGVSLLLFDGARDTTAWTRIGATSFGVRQSVGFTYRIGTGTPAHVDDPMRIATGDGQNDLEFVSATDVVFGPRIWMSVIARYTIQQDREAMLRIPDASGSPFVPVERRRFSRHELGNRLDVSVYPRWLLNERAAVGLGWRWVRQDGERITELAPFTDGIALEYAGADMSAHEVGVGFTWSTLASWHRGRARWPLEIQWDRRVVIAGDGDQPRFNSDRISVRVYARLWGR